MSSPTFYIIPIFVLALISSLYLLPKISQIVTYKKLMDVPNMRSSHSKAIPHLGGVAFFVLLILSFYFTSRFDENNTIIAILPGLTILFLLGLKDDLVILSPFSKLLGQISAALFLVFHGKENISSLHGFMGIEDMPVFVSGILGVLIIIVVVNAINLIDGIDGLAGTVGVIMSSAFGILFFLLKDYFQMLTAVVMVGMLLGFLRFNLSQKRKIFMGDTGSMIIGFVIGVMAVDLLATDTADLSRLPFNFENLPYVVAAILIIPLFDTGRVFFIRIMQRKSPFTADRNHIHHLIIDHFQVSHRRTSFYIGVVNFILLSLFIFLAMRTTQWQLLVVFLLVIIVGISFFYFLGRLIGRKKLKEEEVKI
ncbi:undecaprenyl/decaprenyl-phosphate alpha-N-acetylglucosaminyl 1-phosphate transferase [Brumimicrobium salinarum]|uniref:Undecaprenyl/decaprenyl-phosphate alpha-N-acetylglucosaminyl 1-phosphate transferase n=1 Tax=Brumimicrobium salinarum TaxID=2058658 RepID=A0A2I0R018_9FLAO|nr:MraY family glycosyltransferase [Brumimicrobium salinarum]PKR79934.1 undecaprenyl/decaprenyl-phosphate alpha-N-acetylglucosaminyl 1-phosphate transferase [Brumimicrobium salinarum]